MHTLLKVISGLVGLIGLFELLPGAMQWIPYLFAKALSSLGGKSPTMMEIASDFPFGPAIFFKLHGMPAAFASPVFLGLSGLFYYFGHMAKETVERSDALLRLEDARRKQNQAERARELAAQAAKAERQAQELQALLFEAAQLSKSIPTNMKRAEEALDLAESEFDEGLLDPFWDAIEVATIELAHVDASARTIASNLDRYGKEAVGNISVPKSATAIATGINLLPSTTN